MADPIKYSTPYETVVDSIQNNDLRGLFDSYKDWTEFSNAKLAPYLSFVLARYVLNIRFTEAEHLIKTDAPTAVSYAKQVIRGPWKEAELTIAADGMAAADYAVDVLGKLWPSAEPAIFTVSIAALYYVKHLIKHEHKPAESIISQHPNTLYRYANEVLQARWVAKENALLTFQHPMLSVLYAKDCVKGRWIAAEATIKANAAAQKKYQKEVLKQVSVTPSLLSL